MNAKQSWKGKNIVMLTVDAESYSLSTIDLAVAMAASLRTRLHGLFIENEDLMRVVELPFSREITFPTAQERSTDAAIMQRSLRAMAEQFRKYLAEAAQLSQVAWSYDYVRGRTHDIGLKSEHNFAYTIVGQAVSIRSKSVYSRRPRRLLLVENHSRHLAHALKAVMRRLGNEDIEITVIKSFDGAGATPATQKLVGKSPRATWVELGHEQLSGVLSDSRNAYDYIIVSRQEPVESLREILKKSLCPVILVS